MFFDYTDDEKLLQKSVNRILKDQHDLTKVREFIDNPNLSDSLTKLLAEQGLLGIVSWDEKSKSVEGITFAVLASIEAGKFLLPFPLLENYVSSYTLQKYSSNSLVDDLMSGEKICTVAWESRENSLINNQVSGKYTFVPFAGDADFMLATAGENVVLVDLKDACVSVTRRSSFDETYPLYDVTLNNYYVPAENILDSAANEEMQILGRVLLSAEMTGLSQEILERTVEYTKVRKQFDQPIAKFQALKHMAAECYVLLEGSKTIVDYATAVIDSKSDDDLNKVSSMVKAYVSDASHEISGASIQMHGGIGFTWESDVHLFFKRSRRSVAMLGDVYYHREQIAQFIIDKKAEVIGAV